MTIGRTFLAAAALVGASAAPAYAVTINPTAVTASSAFAAYDAAFAIDGNPLSDWASNGMGAGTSLAINLGAVYELATGTVVDRVTSGGPNNTFFGGVTDFTTSFTLQACATAACTDLLGSALSFSKSAPVSPTSAADFAYEADLAGLTGQYFLYSVTGAAGLNVGLSSLSFEGTLVPAVPEPATWALMILGFGIVGSALRRRRAQVRFNFA